MDERNMLELVGATIAATVKLKPRDFAMLPSFCFL